MVECFCHRDQAQAPPASAGVWEPNEASLAFSKCSFRRNRGSSLICQQTASASHRQPVRHQSTAPPSRDPLRLEIAKTDRYCICAVFTMHAS